MKQFFSFASKKLNELIRALVINGIILIILAVLVAWSNLLLRLLIGMIILVIAYSFFYGAYKLWTIKKNIP